MAVGTKHEIRAGFLSVSEVLAKRGVRSVPGPRSSLLRRLKRWLGIGETPLEKLLRERRER